MEKFKRIRRWGLFVEQKNLNYVAGHVRLFGDNGPVVFQYHQEAPSSDWATRQIWNFYLFAVLYISTGKTTGINGWHFIPLTLRFKKESHGFSFLFRFADVYKNPGVKQRKKPLWKKPLSQS